MKRQVQFSEQLIRERKRHGWSQEKVAQLLGIDAKTVGRWERDETFPTLQLHEPLCLLFKKTSEELGLYLETPNRQAPLDETQSSDRESSSLSVQIAPPSGEQIFQQHEDKLLSQRVSIEERIQMILRNNAVIDHTQLFGVDALITKIREDLFASQAGWIISLFGEGGIGKTALAYEIVARYAAEAGFTRIAWVSAKTFQLLPDGSLLRHSSAELQWTNLVKKLADQLAIPLAENSNSWVADFQHGMRSLPSRERYLLVVDNLETVDDVAEAIHYLGSDQIIKPHKLIVTTRHALLGKTPYLVERQIKGLERGGTTLYAYPWQ